MQHHGKFYIDGEWVEPAGSSRFELVNPATEEPFATISLGSPEDVDRAVRAARRAFPAYSRLTPSERIDLLEQIIATYRKREADVMAVLTQEMGAPVSLTGHTAAAVAEIRQAIDNLKTYQFETRLGDDIVQREPIGVAGLITPWNWPVHLISIKLSGALAAGCTVVLKPSEYTPLSAIVIAEILHEAGVPKGVFNMVIGDGPTVGHAISAHDGIDIVSFTGSTRAGILVAEAAAPSVKRVSQELGGKSANIVLPDADLVAAARFNVARGFVNSGQSCHSPTRLLVHEDQLEEMLGHLKAAVAEVRVGSPLDPSTTMGPVVNRSQFERIQNYIKIALDEGGRLVAGGLGRPEGLNRGYYVRPTIFADIAPDMTIAQQEIFGPVTAVISYKSEDDAMEIANGTAYGLGAYVFSRDRERALGVARQFRAGRVFYNGASANAVAPMGGYKKSGNGREIGVFGLEEYLEVKAIIGFD
jgi:aldehyde dehydrogenase (NAD+)